MLAKSTSTQILDGNEVMKENLSRYNPHFLGVQQFAEGAYALYRKGKTEAVSLTPQQQNLIDWYNSSLEKFAYPKRSDNKIYHATLDKLQKIRAIEEAPNHFLKIIIEMILNYVLLEELKKEIPNENISLYGTSSYDDIFGGVDAVIGYDTEFAGRKMRFYLGVDYCVTNNKRYIQEKDKKRRMTNLEEFNFMIGYRENPIPRIIKAFDPYVISHLYVHTMIAITQGKKPNFPQLYNSLRNSSENPTIRQALATSGIVNEILKK